MRERENGKRVREGENKREIETEREKEGGDRQTKGETKFEKAMKINKGKTSVSVQALVKTW